MEEKVPHQWHRVIARDVTVRTVEAFWDIVLPKAIGFEEHALLRRVALPLQCCAERDEAITVCIFLEYISANPWRRCTVSAATPEVRSVHVGLLAS